MIKQEIRLAVLIFLEIKLTVLEIRLEVLIFLEIKLAVLIFLKI
jgi:hypothetical protein